MALQNNSLMKICNTCEHPKPKTDFYRDARLVDGLCGTCKTCVRLRNKHSIDKRRAQFNEQRRTYRKANPEKFRELNRRYVSRHRKAVNFRKTLWRYGLSKEDYQRLLTVQDKRCAICLYRKRLVVDHNHKTGLNRGLLCDDCNKVLGFLHDNIWTAERVMEYLRDWAWTNTEC